MRLNKHVRDCIFSAHTTEMREVKEGEVIKFKGHMAEFVRACDPETVVLRDMWGEERPVPADIVGLIVSTLC